MELPCKDQSHKVIFVYLALSIGKLQSLQSLQSSVDVLQCPACMHVSISHRNMEGTGPANGFSVPKLLANFAVNKLSAMIHSFVAPASLHCGGHNVHCAFCEALLQGSIDFHFVDRATLSSSIYGRLNHFKATHYDYLILSHSWYLEDLYLEANSASRKIYSKIHVLGIAMQYHNDSECLLGGSLLWYDFVEVFSICLLHKNDLSSN